MEFQIIECFFPDAHCILCKLIVHGRADVRLLVWGADVSDCSELDSYSVVTSLFKVGKGICSDC